MINLNDKETELLFTIKGYTPLNYIYQNNVDFDISNKLLFLYPELSYLTTINHDIIRLIQKLNVESNELSNIILSFNYSANNPGVSLPKILFSEIFSLIESLYIKEENNIYTLNNEEIQFDKSLMMDNEPTIEEELSNLTIEEGLKFIRLYYHGHPKRKKGNDILFEKYLKDNPKLMFGDLLYIEDNFFNVSVKININSIQNILESEPIPIEIDGEKEYICFRKSGECSDWGLPYIRVIYSYEINDNNLYDLRYIELTSGDDYTQGYWVEDMTKNELDKFIDDVIINYLDICKDDGMKNSTNFKEYFLANGVKEDDLDFN